MEAVVEQVRDGSTLRIYLLPEFQFVQVFVAGIQVCAKFCCYCYLLPSLFAHAANCFTFTAVSTNGKESCT